MEALNISDPAIAIIAVVLCVIGILGSFLPVLPGPPISYGGILLLSLQTDDANSFSTNELIIWLIVVVVVTVLDYVIPTVGTKKYGGSKYGVWGSTIGTILGIFPGAALLGPFGIIIGPAVGAFVGEMIYQKDTKVALRAAWGSFLGFLAGTALKLLVTVIALIFVVWYGFW